MTSTQKFSPVLTGILTTAGVLVIVLALRAVNGLITPLLVAALLAILIKPLLNWMRSKGISYLLALLITIVLFITIVLGFVLLVGLSLQHFAASFSESQADLTNIGQVGNDLLRRFNIDPSSLSNTGVSVAKKIVKYAANFTGGLAAGLVQTGLILATGVFFLIDSFNMEQKVKNITSIHRSEKVKGVIKYVKDVRRYMQITAFIGFLTSLGNVLFLWYMDVEFAVLWGILAFVLSFVPNIGFMLSVIPPALIALLDSGASNMLIVVVGFVLINGFSETVIKPHFIADSLDISMGTSFVSLTLWAWVLGPVGAILAIPMTILLQTILASQEESRWIAYMMTTGTKPYYEETEPTDSE